jgi:hypothetical protein
MKIHNSDFLRSFVAPGETAASLTPAAFLVAVAVASSACVINIDDDAIVVRDEKRFSVGTAVDLTVETFDGSVAVQSWDRPEVLVQMEKRGPDREMASAIEVSSTQDGDRIEIRAREPKRDGGFVGIGNLRGTSVSFTVSVPRSLTLRAQTGDGSIALDDVSGTIDLRSGDGSIRAAGITGEVTARTEDGSIHVEGAMAALRAETGDGSVVIEADEGSAMKSDWNVSTGDGSIVFRVPGNFNADIDATSRDGSVRGELTGLQHERSEDGRESLKGRLGSGGQRVLLRSGDGSIRIVNR